MSRNTNTRAAYCDGCIYWRLLSSRNRHPGSLRVCHFLLDTGNQRGCSAEDCTKKTTIGRVNA